MIIITLLLILVTTILYIFIKWNYSKTYWKRRGLDYIEPSYLYGSSKELFKRAIPFGDLMENFYKEFKSRGEKHGGVFLGSSPIYIPVDIEIIKNILQKDFSHFTDRGVTFDEKNDPLAAHLFNLDGERWRNLRTKLTPTFTSGKLKMMFSTMVACTSGLKGILEYHSNDKKPVDIKDVAGRYTTDIIGSVAFGIDCNSLKNPDSDFRKYGKKIFQVYGSKVKRILQMFISRRLLKKLGLVSKTVPQDVEDFFLSVVKSTVNYRETNNINRKDVLQLLLQIKNYGKVADDDKVFDNNKDTPKGNYLTMNEIAAQCFVFFLAGFETSATAMTFALLELALNQDIQDKLREEIVSVLEKHNGEITYDAVMEMQYLDKVVHETLRKHPSVPMTLRKCSKNYKVPGTDVVIEKDTVLFISIQGIHNDPDFYPDPDKFDPERFNEENKASRPAMTFLAFGDGPRVCIGLRFGLLQAKVGLIAILRNFKVTLNENTKLPIEHDTEVSITAVKGDVWLDVTEIN